MGMSSKRPIIVFLGPPGAGKGTQAKKLSSEKKLCHISTGEMLRAAVASGSELGKRVKETLDAGNLVSDDLMIEIVKDRISHDDCNPGLVLDGFPRTVTQAKALGTMLETSGESVTSIVMFDVSEDTVKARLAGRSAQEGRSDDSEKVQLERIRIYREQTEPLVEYYEKAGLLKRVDAAGDVETVYTALLKTLHQS